MSGDWDSRPVASRQATFDEGKPALDASRVGLLAALIAEAWPEISALSVDEFAAMPEVVRRLLSEFWNAGTTRTLPHQVAIEDARAGKGWWKSVASKKVDEDALRSARTQIKALEADIRHGEALRSDLAQKLDRAIHRADVAEFAKGCADERTGDRDETIGQLEAQLKALGVEVGPFVQQQDAA